MSKVNGAKVAIETCLNVKKGERVLVLTDTSKETIDDAYGLNIEDFIEKPINRTLLMKKIETALARKIVNDDFLLQKQHRSYDCNTKLEFYAYLYLKIDPHDQ